MPALKGSLSYVRFFVDRDIAQNPGATYEPAIESRRFMPLTPTGDVAESMGWVPMESPFDEDIAFTRDLFLFGETIALTFRRDVYSIPSEVLKRETVKAVEKLAGEDGRTVASYGKSQVRAIKQSVLIALRAKTIPRARTIDVVWTPSRRELRIFGRGKIVEEGATPLFERTFGVRVMPAIPQARTLSVDLDEQMLTRLNTLTSSIFVDATAQELVEVTEQAA